MGASSLHPIFLALNELLWAAFCLGPGETLWTVARTWPIPMPMHADSDALPVIFSTSCDMDVPCMIPIGGNPQRFNASKINLLGSYCFSLNNANCILLRKRNITAWLNPLQNSRVSVGMIFSVLTQGTQGQHAGSGSDENGSNTVNITTLAITSTARVPQPYDGTQIGTRFTASPHCEPDTSFPPVFTICQSKSWERKSISEGFTMSPPLKRFVWGRGNASSVGDGWPWFQWLVSNKVGAVSDISALARTDDVVHKMLIISGTVKTGQLYNITVNGEKSNVIYSRAEVCVQAPFAFLLVSSTNHTVNCAEDQCWLAECWNNTWPTAVVMKVPTIVPIPVEVDPDTFPLMTLLRERRDFGIASAIVAAIVFSAGSAITAAIAMANQVQTAQTINKVVEQTSRVLETQNVVNKHLLSGIVAANQRIDLLQVQIEELYSLVQVGCISQMKHMCITPLRFINAGNESKRLEDYLAGNWSREAERFVQQRLVQIAELNGTRVDPVTFEDLTSWLTSVFTFFKEWVGVELFGALVCLGVFLCLWLLCLLQARQARDKAVIVQALAAIDQGISPQVWLASLKRDL